MLRIPSNRFGLRHSCDLVLGNPLCFVCLYEAKAGRLRLPVSDGTVSRPARSSHFARSVFLLERENLIELHRGRYTDNRATYLLTSSGRRLVGLLGLLGWEAAAGSMRQGSPLLVSRNESGDILSARYAESIQTELRILRKILRVKGMAECLLACPAQEGFTLKLFAGTRYIDASLLGQMLITFASYGILQRRRLRKHSSCYYEMTDYGRRLQVFFGNLLA